MATHERPLSADLRSELHDLIGAGFEAVASLLDDDDAIPDEAEDRVVVTAIGAAISAWREEPPDDLDDPEQVAYALGALWGDAARSALAWEWAMVTSDGRDELLALVSPDRAYYILPQLYLYRLLTEAPPGDNTAVLLFNMLVAGSAMPPSSPKQYCELG